MAGVGHQHAIAAGEAEIGGQRRALVAALFLDDLDQQHLAAADHVLDLVAAAQILALAAQRVGGALVAPLRLAALLGLGRRLGLLAFAQLVRIVVLGRHRRVVDLGHAAVGVRLVLVVELGRAQRRFLGGMLGLLAEQRLAILLGDLIIIRVDFAEGQEAVAIAAIIDERRLQRRFDPGYLGEIDIAFELLVLGGFEIKFLDSISLDHGHPGFFLVARVDQHAHGH